MCFIELIATSHSWWSRAASEALLLSPLFCSHPFHRCVYVGDTDAWCEALSRSEEQ